MTDGVSPETHPFRTRPHHTMVVLSFPVLLSLIAEPLMGLVDTAFVARLGAPPLAALGIATTLLSTVFWAFNFLGIGTQTEIAAALGSEKQGDARSALGVALLLALALGSALALLLWPVAPIGARWMGAVGEVEWAATEYLRIRLLSGPAVLVTFASFGALRGLQDMRTPLLVAIAANLLNAVLDPLLIFGLAGLPRLGLAGAAWASTAGLWLGASLAALAALRRLGLPREIPVRRAGALLVTGRDLVLRTAALMLFTVLATRAANRIGADAGAAHQVIRQVFLLTAFLLDAFAASAQSLVGYFLAAADRSAARHAARITCIWSAATGFAVGILMWISEPWVAGALVPASALPWFGAAWLLTALTQPISALSFGTDGILWGAADYRYLRNAMFVATGAGALALYGLETRGGASLAEVWAINGLWLLIRAGFGVARIWPGIGTAPFATPLAERSS